MSIAAEQSDSAVIQPVSTISDGKYTMSSVENSESRFNILINEVEQTVQFAIVYLDSPDYFYEFQFSLNDVAPFTSSTDISLIQSYCFDNANHWREIYIPTAVEVIEAEENVPHVYTADSNVSYFENWLINKYGSEFSGRLLSTKAKNGTTMYLKDAFQVYAYKDISYAISATMTVIGFCTGILGLKAGATVFSVIGAIASTGGLLLMGETVSTYVLRANWFKYATVVSGTGYPYGLTDKFIYYDGYAYTGTGSCNVDSASASTDYVPSSTVYYSNNAIFSNAFSEYQQIGFQEGNF